MNSVDLKEAASVVAVVLDALLLTLQGQTGLIGAQTRFLCGQLSVNGESELSAGGSQFWIDLAACFESAQQAGATFETMDIVRSTSEALTPTGLPGIAVRNFSVRMSLVEQARILAATTFVSRQDIDNYFDQINASFDVAELVAADNQDNVAYVLLIAIHAAVSNDLANRSRPLPKMVTYSFPARMPSLALAQRLYSDASRGDQLIAENKPVHPLFMPSSGNALSE